MYGEFAHLWPLFSAPEDYAEEARYWRQALRDRLGPGRHPILELGVGGGNNLSHLTAEFAATAVDRSARMLAQCSQLNPGVPVHLGDMRTVRLGQRFRAVLIHDAVSYLQTEDDLRQAFATAVAHLEPGGVLIVAPDDYCETFHSPRVSHGTNSDGETEVTSFEYQYDPDPSDTTTETVMVYLIRRGREVRVEEDHHRMGLFPRQRWLDLMAEAGFSVESLPYPVHEDGREAWLLVGVLER
jgi:SAM-dependent methyltransferase